MPFESLKFTDDPQIPMNDSVHRYLDVQMPLDKLASMCEKGFTLPQAGENVKAFSETLVSKEVS